ncbi:MAG: excinuclease ABC subunit UvrA [Opitutaceae bacterium]|nr:excinuclease ABC subunit UvrA [Cytophagales bacterium]
MSVQTDFVPVENFEQLDPKEYIIIKGARVNNLKNLSVAIPRNKLVVVTGLSGSGKSSLAFNTLFAEGQRQYVESLSSYARQFLARMEKPEADYIKGVAPAIAIEQKVSSRNPRSTVGTTTEIYDYLKLLYARIGVTLSPISGNPVRKETVQDVMDFITSFDNGSKLHVLCPYKIDIKQPIEPVLNTLIQKGFTRLAVNNEVSPIEDLLEDVAKVKKAKTLEILIDRNVLDKNDEDNLYRLADSIQTAFYEGHGYCAIDVLGKEKRSFSDRFELDGMEFEEPSLNLFSFNNPYGACKTCEGFGKVLGIDEDLVIPNKNLSVFEGAIAPWKGEKMGDYLEPLVKNGIHFDFPIHRAYYDLDENHKRLIWEGNEHFTGLNDFFKFLETQTYKIQYRVMLSRYRGRTVCPDCRGSRLRKDAGYVKIGGRSIQDLVLLPVDDFAKVFAELELTEYEKKIAGRIQSEVYSRLGYLQKVGLGYLTLNRLTNSLSGGEFQRIKLATALGSALVGSMYILDEPSIGLHPRDTRQLVEVLLHLRDLGNTVIVVEHEEEIMRAADQIIDIGPEAGNGGGHLVAQGSFKKGNYKALPGYTSHTLEFLNGTNDIALPVVRRKPLHWINIKGARENNLKNVSASFPLQVLCVITGVSGSGKSTLVKKILYPAVSKICGGISNEESGKVDRVDGSLDKVKSIEFIDQNPIGKSSRSNPVTYTKAYDAIRNLLADQPLSKQRGYKPSHFSFNVDGGRCEICQGEGEVKIEMQFMADIYLKCEGCEGKRFKQEILDIQFNGKNVHEILDLTVEDSLTFFSKNKTIFEKLKPLNDVGLGYVRLGQSSNTLSGGEAQRVKLASYLNKGNEKHENILFIFDEPTTGLHFHDIKKLLSAINALIEQGNSVIIIEHNMEVIKCADWIIDLGPEGGEHGGDVCYAGTPENMVGLKNNHTAYYLKSKLS